MKSRSDARRQMALADTGPDVRGLLRLKAAAAVEMFQDPAEDD